MEAARALIPIIGAVSMCTTIFGIYYLRNKENMALIDRGINPREGFKKFGSLTYLKYGLLLIGGGLGLLSAYFIDEGLGIGEERPAIYFSLIGIFGGLGLIISYFIEKKEMNRHMHKD